jgi:hypothetical protein
MQGAALVKAASIGMPNAATQDEVSDEIMKHSRIQRPNVCQKARFCS